MLVRPAAKRIYPWLFVPLTLAPVVAAFAVFVWLNPAGLLSRLSYGLGLHGGVQAFPRLVHDAGSVGILVVHTLLVGPVLAIVFRQQAKAERMQALRKTARSLGAGDGTVFLRVFVPALWRRSGAFVLLYGIYLFGTYEVPLLLGRSHPRVLTVYITDQLTRFDLGNLPLAHAAASAYALVVLAMVARLLSRWNRNLLKP
jgi:putative spermidine/putrescine transport system permease protein